MRQRRSGYTLVEVMAVMVILAVVLGALVVAFHIASRAVAGIQANGHRDLQLHRLAAHLRTDLHLAEKASLQPGEARAETAESILDIKLANKQTIQYRRVRSGIIRERREGRAVKQREVYSIDGLESVTWAIDQRRNTPLVRLTIERQRSQSMEVAATEDVVLIAAVSLSPLTSKPVTNP